MTTRTPSPAAAGPGSRCSLLSESERAIAASVRGFGEQRVLPDIAEWYERGELPEARQLAKELGALGVLGMHLEGYGCAGASAVDYGLACLELEAIDSGLRSLVSVQGSLAMFAIWRFGSEEQKNEWLPRMAAGEAIGCFGLTEPDHGSDPAGMTTRARRDGDDYVLNGTKQFISGGGFNDVSSYTVYTSDLSMKIDRAADNLRLFEGRAEAMSRSACQSRACDAGSKGAVISSATR